MQVPIAFCVCLFPWCVFQVRSRPAATVGPQAARSTAPGYKKAEPQSARTGTPLSLLRLLPIAPVAASMVSRFEQTISNDIEDGVIQSIAVSLARALNLPTKNATLAKRVIGLAFICKDASAFEEECKVYGTFEKTYIKKLYDRIIASRESAKQ